MSVTLDQPVHQHDHQARQFWREVRDVDGVRWFWVQRCACGDEIASLDTGPLAAALGASRPSPADPLLLIKSAYIEGFNAARDTDGESAFEAWLHSAAKLQVGPSPAPKETT